MSAYKNNFQVIQAVREQMTLHGKCVISASELDQPTPHYSYGWNDESKLSNSSLEFSISSVQLH